MDAQSDKEAKLIMDAVKRKVVAAIASESFVSE
jgi:hypothetical protein